MGIKAFAAKSKGQPLEPIEYEPPALRDDHVEIRVEHCGVCYSDPAIIDDEFGMSSYPLIPGHEVVGVVTKVGSSAEHLRGKRVGVGWQASSCGRCRHCLAGDEKFCGTSEYTAVRGQGGFAEAMRCKARFAIPIPDTIEPALAGPLMCGGATVYETLMTYGVRPGQQVAVIGIGGLGHLALQFARAMGAEVTAFSTSSDKADEATGFGAHHFVATREDPDFMARLARRFDFILSTVFADDDWDAWMQMLAPRGALCHVGIPSRGNTVRAVSLILGDKRIVGSNMTSPKGLENMLAFAQLHSIRPKTQHFRLSEVNSALSHLKNGRARYRCVLDMIT